MPDPITLGAAVVAATNSATGKVVEEAIQGISKTFHSKLGKVTRSALDRAVVALQIGFEDYLNTSYNRCQIFKSILSPHAPIDLITHYVHVNLSCGQSICEDYDLVEGLLEKRHIVVTGLAGSGKSMFMKYLTISHFEHPKGAIPLFVELRHLNTVTNPDLLTFIRNSCTSKDHNVTAEQFALSLRAGAMILVLDGFDELHHEIRDEIQKQILEIQKDYPETTVIVSSRPDERFSSWSSYYIYKVESLTKQQVTNLIESLDYKPAVKRRFLKEVKSRLYNTHRSFLSSPLLASIMLLTYEEFAEIPQKMHAFYGQAFDTLIQRHDAQKEQYQRKTHTQLTREGFKDCFSAFCAMSYLEQRFSFNDEALKGTADSSVKYMIQTSEGFPKSVTSDQFISDLFESVCMLQKDGLETVFVHRSFQEYFAALFVRTLHGDRIKKFLDRYATRWDDSVIPMALDMSRQIIENEWIVPTIEKLEKILDLQNPRDNLFRKLNTIIPNLFVQFIHDRIMVSARDIEWETFGKIESLAKSYPKHLVRSPIFAKFSQQDVKILRAKLQDKKYASLPKYNTILALITPPEADADQALKVRNRRNSGSEKLMSLSEEDDWWLEEIGIGDAFEYLSKAFTGIKREIRSRDRRGENILEEFF